MHRRRIPGPGRRNAGRGLLHARPLPRRRAGRNKPVKLILPYAPGGATDLIGRPWADKLTQAFGQQFVIENRGGAGGMIGTEAASKAAPDGYTFLLTPNATLSVLPQHAQDALRSRSRASIPSRASATWCAASSSIPRSAPRPSRR